MFSSVGKMHPQATPDCFQSCGQVGTIYHMKWQCPKATKFWIRIFNLIWSIMGVIIPRSPEIALFQRLDAEMAKNKQNKTKKKLKD